jgi:hypothetical protein
VARAKGDVGLGGRGRKGEYKASKGGGWGGMRAQGQGQGWIDISGSISGSRSGARGMVIGDRIGQINVALAN